MDARTIGKRIQAARLERGWTQAVLAQKADLTPKYLSNIECGEKLPKLETFITIANALEIDANSLLVDELNVAPSIICSELGERLQKMPLQRQQRLLRLFGALIEDAEQDL